MPSMERGREGWKQGAWIERETAIMSRCGECIAMISKKLQVKHGPDVGECALHQ